MKQLMKREEGQAILIIAGALLVLVALMALVVDAGNAYVQRRQMQNAMDSGAQAGSVALAQAKKNGQIANAIDQYVTANGVNPNQISKYYVVQDSSGNNIVYRSSTIDQFTTGLIAPTVLTVNGVSLPVIGVQVEGNKTFPTYLAGVVGWKQMTVNGSAGGFAKCGACSADGLFPATLSAATFNENGVVVLHEEQRESAYTYTFWDNTATVAGNVGWITWNSDVSNNTLVSNMNTPSNSGSWSVGQNINGATGTMSSSGVRTALDSIIDTGRLVTIPIYDTATGTGSNALYHIKGFARFRITCYYFSSNQTHGTCVNAPEASKYIQAKLQLWTDAQAEGGCADFGACTVKVRPPVDTTRALKGTVKFQKITLQNVPQVTTHVPVDVVEVIDTSYSMQCDFRGYQPGTSSCYSTTNGKLSGAKTALTNFSSNLQPNLGDRASLISFPAPKVTGASYNAFCTNQSVNFYQYGQKLLDFTNNITGTNGITTKVNGLVVTSNTPSGSAMQIAKDLLLGTTHTSGNLPVIIFASDGRANVRSRTIPGQYAGDNSDLAACNQISVDDLTAEANDAKAKGIMIFSIAIGADFNGNANIATPNTASNTYFFQATDAASMTSIYTQIANRLKVIQNEQCYPVPTENFAPYATLTIKNTNTGHVWTNVRTTSTGEYVLNDADVQPGTYIVQSATVTVDGYTYNQMTTTVGGDPLAANTYPTVLMGPGSGTTQLDVALKSTNPPSCH